MRNDQFHIKSIARTSVVKTAIHERVQRGNIAHNRDAIAVQRIQYNISDRRWERKELNCIGMESRISSYKVVSGSN
jgi:hypothetical protein